MTLPAVKLTVVVERLLKPAVERLLTEAGVTGWSVFPGGGHGAHGVHRAELRASHSTSDDARVEKRFSTGTIRRDCRQTADHLRNVGQSRADAVPHDPASPTDHNCHLRGDTPDGSWHDAICFPGVSPLSFGRSS